MDTSPRTHDALSGARAWITGVAKLGLCGATIFAIGWAFLTFGPDGEVATSQADIADLDFLAPATSSQRFVSALDRLGHEKPRVYDYNGNAIFFSTRASPKRPRELILEYQRAFVEEGVNERVYDIEVDLDALRRRGPRALKQAAAQRQRAMLDGQVQVLYHDDERVIMGAATLDLKHAPPPIHSVDDDGVPVAEFDFANIFQAHRHIEAVWHPILKHTVVTASWGDESFDIKKAFPQDLQSAGAQNMAPDLVVPSCLGCERLTRFASQLGDKPYVVQVFKSFQSLPQVAEFYRVAMRTRGWKETEHSKGLERFAQVGAQEHAGSHVLQFAKGNQHVTLTLHPDDDGTSITASQTD